MFYVIPANFPKHKNRQLSNKGKVIELFYMSVTIEYIPKVEKASNLSTPT